jgi:Domain of unknown function (DUF4832)/Domain of unknown function (DUF4874)
MMDQARDRAALLRRGALWSGLLVLASTSSLFWHTSVLMRTDAAGAAITESTAKALAALTTKTYLPSNATIVNPERGFFHQPGDCNEYNFTTEQLRGYRDEPERISLARCIFYLGMSQTVDQAQITRFRHQAQTARDAGVKLIVRFAYSKSTAHSPQSPNDVPVSVVRSHLDQLSESLRDYRDVILMVESGFVGAYGEGAYSENFGDLTVGATLTDAQWADRQAVVEKLLDILPAGRKVLVRTPRMKRAIYGDTVTTSTDVAAGMPIGRIGHFNDCFLRGDDDAGTYRPDDDSYPPPDDRSYVARDTRRVPMGGETCGSEANPPRSDCPNAQTELARYHWSVLNRDWSPAVLSTWGPCVKQVQKRLGYRFRLVSTASTPTVRRGAVLPFRMLMRNTGWAGTINRRPVVLVLRKITPPKSVYQVSIGTAADWKAQTTRVRACKVRIPITLPLGSYRMLLRLPDPAPGLATDPRFSIRLANVGLWSQETGLNNLLRTVTVQPQVAAPFRETTRRPSAPCTSHKAPAR